MHEHFTSLNVSRMTAIYSILSDAHNKLQTISPVSILQLMSPRTSFPIPELNSLIFFFTNMIRPCVSRTGLSDQAGEKDWYVIKRHISYVLLVGSTVEIPNLIFSVLALVVNYGEDEPDNIKAQFYVICHGDSEKDQAAYNANMLEQSSRHRLFALVLFLNFNLQLIKIYQNYLRSA